MKLQDLYSQVRKAIQDYQMIAPGDKIAIGLSGGKDSLALLYALSGLQKFYPIPFTICAIRVDLGYSEGFLQGVSSGNLPELADWSYLEKLCKDLSVEYYVVPTNIAELVNQDTIKKSQCYLCAKHRKGALVSKALELGCTKIAYAHHMDDYIETMAMSMLYEGKFYAFPPVTYFEDCGLSVIRPLMYLTAGQVKGFIQAYNLYPIKNPCPFDGQTKRTYIRDLLKDIYKENPESRKKLFTAITNGNIYDWPDKKRKEEA